MNTMKLIGWKYLSKTVAIYTVISNSSLSLFLELTKHMNLGIDDFVINALFGGAIIGASVGFLMTKSSIPRFICFVNSKNNDNDEFEITV